MQLPSSKVHLPKEEEDPRPEEKEKRGEGTEEGEGERGRRERSYQPLLCPPSELKLVLLVLTSQITNPALKSDRIYGSYL